MVRASGDGERRHTRLETFAHGYSRRARWRLLREKVFALGGHHLLNRRRDEAAGEEDRQAVAVRDDDAAGGVEPDARRLRGARDLAGERRLDTEGLGAVRRAPDAQ